MAPKKKAVKKSAAKPVKKAAKPVAKAARPAPKTVSTAAAAKVHARAVHEMKTEDTCCGGACGCDTTRCCGFSISCPLFGVITTGTFWLASILAFVVAFGFDMWWNGHLLMPSYEATAQFWRPMEQMRTYLPYCILYHAGVAMSVSALVLLMGRTGWWGGFITGVLAMAPMAISQLSVYMFMPLPSMHLPTMWALGALVQGGLMGLAITSIARTKTGMGCCR
jgi:hypothetical protein